MEKKVIDVIRQKPPLTPEEFDALLEDYKIQNPAKYAVKVANGEFDRQRAKLQGLVAPVAPKPEVSAPKEVEKEEVKVEAKGHKK